MTDATEQWIGRLRLAKQGDQQAFADLFDRHRGELQAHCYRILGSVQDAEDALQETMLGAWRGLADFREQASFRTWLYRIATNRCLNALRAGARRPEEVRTRMDLPEPTRRIEPTWVQPYPDSLLDGIPEPSPGPDARYELKETMTLAFITALQRLPARQRSILILRDVLGFRTAEVARMLETSEDGVHSALKRARDAFRASEGPQPSRSTRSLDAADREVAARFAAAFEADDIDGVVALMTQEAKLTMPPEPLEYQGPDVIASFMRDRCSKRLGRGFKLVPVAANTQPAFGCYLKDAAAPVARPHGIVVLTIADRRITAMTRFLDNSVYPHFGLPRLLRL